MSYRQDNPRSRSQLHKLKHVFERKTYYTGLLFMIHRKGVIFGKGDEGKVGEAEDVVYSF